MIHLIAPMLLLRSAELTGSHHTHLMLRVVQVIGAPLRGKHLYVSSLISTMRTVGMVSHASSTMSAASARELTLVPSASRRGVGHQRIIRGPDANIIGAIAIYRYQQKTPLYLQAPTNILTLY